MAEDTPATDDVKIPVKPKRERKYIETGEPDNKLFTVIMIVCALLLVGGFAYFMIFNFHDMFFTKVIAQK